MTNTQTHRHRHAGAELSRVSDGGTDTLLEGHCVYYILSDRDAGLFHIAEQEGSLLYIDKQGGRVVIYNQTRKQVWLLLVWAVSVGVQSSGYKYPVEQWSYSGNFLHTLWTATEDLEDNFAIPLSFIQGRFSHSTGLKLWNPLSTAHIHSVLYSVPHRAGFSGSHGGHAGSRWHCLSSVLWAATSLPAQFSLWFSSAL